jgi:hypothetical protein
MLEFPTNEVLDAAAEAMFADTNSAWGALPWKGDFHPGNAAVESDLVHVPAFRLLLARELAKTNVCGSFTWHASGMLGYQNTVLGEGGGRSDLSFEGQPPADETTVESRWCDWIAVRLSIAKQIPFFNPFAPAEKRDEQIRSAIALLRQR